MAKFQFKLNLGKTLQLIKSKLNIYDVAIIGSGASGLFLGTFLTDKLKLIIFEKNQKVGNKLRVSGGGKSNITNLNVSYKNYKTENNLLIEQVLNRFGVNNLLSFCRNNKLEFYKDERLVTGAIFCQNGNKIADYLNNKINKSELLLSTEIIKVEKNNELFEIVSSTGLFYSKKVVVASGGISYSSLGTTDIAIKIAEQFEIKTNPFNPALVGLTVQKNEFWFKDLSGISVIAEAKVGEKILQGSLLFAHRGISGPLAMNISLYWQKGEIILNFLPNFEFDKIQYSKKQISTILPLPKNFILAFLKHKNLEDSPCNKINQSDWQKIYELNNYKFSPAGNFGFSKAEVSKGGIAIDELNFNTFESYKIKGLYFIGESVDVTGELGGFNLHWAFASAMTCGEALVL